jgi:hypothetical protein
MSDPLGRPLPRASMQNLLLEVWRARPQTILFIAQDIGSPNYPPVRGIWISRTSLSSRTRSKGATL